MRSDSRRFARGFCRLSRCLSNWLESSTLRLETYRREGVRSREGNQLRLLALSCDKSEREFAMKREGRRKPMNLKENVTRKVRQIARAWIYIYIYACCQELGLASCGECVSREPQIRPDENTSRASRNWWDWEGEGGKISRARGR